jgi:hypothetical protein
MTITPYRDGAASIVQVPELASAFVPSVLLPDWADDVAAAEQDCLTRGETDLRAARCRSVLRQTTAGHSFM